MMRTRPRLSYANVMVTILAFIVLAGGSAYAASHLAKNSVGTEQLKNNSVTTAKIKDGAVTSSKIVDGAVAAGKLADGSVTASKVSGGAVGNAQLADGSVTTGKLAGGAVGSGQLGDGSVTTAKIPDGAITESKLATRYLAASTPGVPVAGANISTSGTVRTWFNRAGGAPTVEHSEAGVYTLVFPGLEEQAAFTNSIALATLSGGAGEISRTSNTSNPLVETFTSAGAPADHEFEFVLFLPGR
jgi:hypothetical protein